MSIHLESVALPLDKIDNALYIDSLDNTSGYVEVKTKTNMTDFDVMEDILANSTVGFKSKRDLMNFQDNGMMYYYFEGDTIEIAFFGTFKKKDINTFVTALNTEFYNKTHQSLTNSDVELQEVTETVNKFKIPSILKNKSIIDEVLENSYGGFLTKNELEEFQNIGKIIVQQAPDDTYDFIFIGDYEEDQAKNYVKSITEEYSLKVQEETYLKVLEKINKQNISLESEIIDNEDSIVLTLKL